jgi:hypothetical protein
MRLLLVLLLLLTYCSTGFAQNFTYTISEKIDVKNFAGLLPLKSDKNGHYYMTIGLGRKYELTFFQTDMKFNIKKQKVYVVEYKEPELLDAFVENDMIGVIIKVYNPKLNNFTIHKFNFDLEGNFKNQAEIFTTKSNFVYKLDDMLFLESSTDGLDGGRNALVWFTIDKKTKITKVETVLLDQHYKLISQRMLNFPLDIKKLKMLSTSLSSEGNMAFLYKEYSSSRKKETTKNDGETVANYQIRLVQIPSEGDNIVLSDVNLVEGFARTLDIYYNDKNELNICGFSSKTLKLDSDKIFVAKIKPDGTVYDTKQTLISQADINKINAANAVKYEEDKDEGIDKNYLVKMVKLFEDGSYDLFVEEDYEYSRTRTEGKNIIITFYYVTNMVLRMHFDPSGNMQKLDILPKQVTLINYGSAKGFRHLDNPNDDNDYFLYNMERNDLEDDVNKVPDRKRSYIRHGEVALTSMSPTGELKRVTLFDKGEKYGRMVETANVVSLGDGKYFFIIDVENDTKLVYFSFK